MRITSQEDYAKMKHLLSLLKEGKVNQAISIIRREKLQGMVSNVLRNYIEHIQYSEIERFDDTNFKEFLRQFKKHRGLFSYIPTGKDESENVLTEISKMLGNFSHPFWRNQSQEMMQFFLLDFIQRHGAKPKTGVLGLRLFSFRPVTPFLLTELNENALRVSNPDTFNDPFDCLILTPIRNAKEELKAEKSYGVKTYIEELQKVRVCCFVGWDDEKKDVPCMNTLMWAHYADSHKGVCIEYSLTSNTPLRDSGIIDSSSRSRLDKVIYKDGPISDRKSLNFNECFLIKDKSWKYENEYRLVHYDTIRNENYYNIPLSTLGLKIECIYFGINCDKRTMELVQNITRDRGIQYLKFDRNKDYMNSIKMR